MNSGHTFSRRPVIKFYTEIKLSNRMKPVVPQFTNARKKDNSDFINKEITLLLKMITVGKEIRFTD